MANDVRRRETPARHLDQRSQEPGHVRSLELRETGPPRRPEWATSMPTVSKFSPVHVGVDRRRFAGQAGAPGRVGADGRPAEGTRAARRRSGCRGHTEPSVQTIQCAPNPGLRQSASVSRGGWKTPAPRRVAIERAAEGVEDDPLDPRRQRGGLGRRQVDGSESERRPRPPSSRREKRLSTRGSSPLPRLCDEMSAHALSPDGPAPLEVPHPRRTPLRGHAFLARAARRGGGHRPAVRW